MANKTKILSFAQAKDASRRRPAQSADTSRNSRSFMADSRSRSSRNSSKKRTSSRRSSFAAARDGYEESVYQEEFEAEYESSRTRSRSTRDDRRKKRTKAKADRMYSRQFADGEGAASDNAPRAALYKGQMGSKQKKAARMQGSGFRLPLPSFSPTSAVKDKASGLVARSSVSPSSLKVLTAVICFVLMCVFLYTPAQQYYHSQRENARLSVEYSSIESRNDALNVQNDILVSDAGIEDTVRQRYGYVRAGESVGVVVGLSEEATDSLRDSEKIEASVLSSSVKAPEEWYTPFLDALFGVE